MVGHSLDLVFLPLWIPFTVHSDMICQAIVFWGPFLV